MDSNGSHHFVEDFGGQGDLLIFVHGLGGTSNTWYPQAQILKRDLRVIGYDMAGAGRSQLYDEITIETHVADLLAIAGNAGGRAKIHLAGHSMGTIICQHFAASHPDKVASLALAGGFSAPSDAMRDGLAKRAAKVRSGGMTAIVDDIVAGGTSADTKQNQPAAAAFVRESILAQNPEGYARNCEALAKAQPADLAQIACPVLLLNGDQDKTAPFDGAQAIASQLKSAEAQKLTGCGHWATIERAKQVSYALTVFYARQSRMAAE